MGIYGHMQPYIREFKCINNLNIYIYIYLIASLCMFICILLLIHTQIYAYIGAFLLAFGPVLYHCSPQRGESPTTPRELHKTTKCKCNVGQALQHIVSVLHLKALDNRGCRTECKELTKSKKTMQLCWKNSPYFSHNFCSSFNSNGNKLSESKWFKVFVCTSLCCQQSAHSYKVQVISQCYMRCGM